MKGQNHWNKLFSLLTTICGDNPSTDPLIHIKLMLMVMVILSRQKLYCNFDLSSDISHFHLVVQSGTATLMDG
jgi:hypothetical protein